MSKAKEVSITGKDETRPCEVCGNEDHIIGVYASRLGPISFNFCGICIIMGAEPEWMVHSTIENCGGLDQIRDDATLIFYDKAAGKYKDLRTGYINIKTRSGQEFATREAIVEHLAKKYPEHVPKMTITEEE